MKKFLFIFLLPILLQAQSKPQYKWFPKLTPDQDLTFDYYSNVGLSWGVSRIMNKYTHKPFLSGVVGFGAGMLRSCFERGLEGKIVSGMGSWGGQLVYIIQNDRKRIKLEESKKIYQ